MVLFALISCNGSVRFIWMLTSLRLLLPVQRICIPSYLFWREKACLFPLILNWISCLNRMADTTPEEMYIAGVREDCKDSLTHDTMAKKNARIRSPNVLEQDLRCNASISLVILEILACAANLCKCIMVTHG